MDQDFNRQKATPSSDEPPKYTPESAVTPSVPPSKSKFSATPKSSRRKVFAIVISITVLLALVVAVASLVMANNKADKALLTAQTTKSEDLEKRLLAIEEAEAYSEKQINQNQNQAVFLEGGQVYFGKITEITKDTMKLKDIYYLKTGSVDKTGNVVGGADVSLVKLGNELHGPEDAMIIERKNVTFWENLKDDGEVSKAIAEYKKAGR